MIKETNPLSFEAEDTCSLCTYITKWKEVPKAEHLFHLGKENKDSEQCINMQVRKSLNRLYRNRLRLIFRAR